ncbi:MAG TPA: hypothetical protein VM938_10710 [Acidimicrobiales bacterium]|nr:hypothetical protein [Acidimicrobiales bacterium]
MKKTTTREYDAEGRLVKETVVEETPPQAQQVPVLVVRQKVTPV